MISRKKSICAILIIAGVFAIAATVQTAIAAGPNGSAAAQTVIPPAVSPQSPRVTAGEFEARKLVLLMDTDKNGKISRAEYMAFMAAEFDRLDVNHDGELDLKELEQSQLTAVHHGGGHR
jgi:hypothetical protein